MRCFYCPYSVTKPSLPLFTIYCRHFSLPNYSRSCFHHSSPPHYLGLESFRYYSQFVGFFIIFVVFKFVFALLSFILIHLT